MRKLTKNSGVIALAVILLTFGIQAEAQQDQSGNAGQGAQSGSQSTGQQAQQPAPAATTPSGPVTGAFTGFLNNLEEGRSMLQYGFSASESAIADPTGIPGSTSVSALTSVSGNLSLNRVGRRSDLVLQVQGGGLVYDTMTSLTSGMGNLSIGDSIQFRRWSLNLSDQLYYLPQTPFGFSGGLLNGTGLGSFGGITSLNPFETPQNTIVSAQNPEITESAGAQANITASARTTWTLNAGWGITDYTHGGFLPSSSYTFGVGYNYRLSSRDTFGAGATAAISDYGVTTNSLDSVSATLTYGHRFSDRLAVQLSGGGVYYGYLSPSGSGRTADVSYTASGGLNYLLGRNSLQVSAIHQVYNGGGFLYGAIQTFVQGSVSRQISRFWQISGGVGFGKASGLASTPTAGISYQTLSGNAALSRQLNPNASIFFQAFVLHQSLSGSACVPAPGVPCASPFTQYVGSAGISWKFRPRPLD